MSKSADYELKRKRIADLKPSMGAEHRMKDACRIVVLLKIRLAFPTEQVPIASIA